MGNQFTSPMNKHQPPDDRLRQSAPDKDVFAFGKHIKLWTT